MLFLKIGSMGEEEKQKELKYVFGTIGSSWEFVDYIFLITGVSRAFTHELVRTRQASYAQQSMRAVNMEDFSFIATGKCQDDKGIADLYNSGNYPFYYVSLPQDNPKALARINLSVTPCCERVCTKT
jgi:thymidylate synthase ThyX